MNILPLPEHSTEITAALQRAKSTFAALTSSLPAKYPDDLHTGILLAYTSQALEHLQSIIKLSEERLSGSALALFRPLVETILRGQWLRTCATEEQVERFRSDPGFSFPDFKALADRLDDRNELEGFFDGFKNAYRTMCDFTHSGHSQISQRVSVSRVGPDYDDPLMVDLLLEATKVMLFHCRFFCRAVGHASGAKALTKVASTY